METTTLDALLKLRGSDPQPLYSVSAVAGLLGCSPVTVRKLIRLGKLDGLRRERRIIGIPHADLAAYLGAKNGGHE